LFKIVSESGIGAGVRRIEAVTGLQAIALYQAEENALKAIATTVKAQRLTDVPSKVADIQAELKATQRTLESLESQLANAAAAEVFSDVKTSHGHSYITAQLQVSGMDGLRQVADNWKTNYPSDVLVLAATVDGRVNLIVTASPSANAAGIKAGELIKAIAPRVGGGGGGRPDMAQAGGKNPAGIAEAFAEVANFLAKV